jgi:hypothetical protein
LPHWHLLHTKKLPRSKGGIFRPTCSTDKVAIVGLLAAHCGAGEAVTAAETT